MFKLIFSALLFGGLASASQQAVSPFKETTREKHREAHKRDSLIVPTLINGTVVPPGSGWDHVVSIVTGSSGCTATIVGPQTIITAAHCAGNGATSVFTYKGVKYAAKMQRSGLYPGRDHDVAVGKTDKQITGAEMATIGGVVAKGVELTLLGYGCTLPGGGGHDGKLRIGTATVTGFSNYDAVSTNGSALCYGDSGGPGFMKGTTEFAAADNKWLLATINSKGNIEDTNYTTRLDTPESKDFLTKYAAAQGVSICGVNAVCDPVGPPPPPGGQTITLSNGAEMKLQLEVPAKWLADPNNNLEWVKTNASNFMKFVAGEK